MSLLDGFNISTGDIATVTSSHKLITRSVDIDVEKIKKSEIVLNTMTVSGFLGSSVDIEKVLDTVRIQEYWVLKDGVIRVEGYKDEEYIYRGMSRKYLVRKDTGKKPFKNAATFYVRINDEGKEWREPCVKVFLNGKYHITGIRVPSQIPRIVDIVRASIMRVDGFTTTCDLSRAYSDVNMMNACIDMCHTLNRTRIQEILINDTHIMSSLELTNYQGVNIKFFWSPVKQREGKPQSGECTCEPRCRSDGKKTTVSDPRTRGDETKCTKITVAPFKTGRVMLIGARSEDQLRDVASWFREFVIANSEKIITGKSVARVKRRPNPMWTSYPYRMSVCSTALISREE